MANYKNALKMFDKCISIGGWAPEIGQAHIYRGNSYEWLGNYQKAKECYLDSLKVYDQRREPFEALADVCERMGQLDQSVLYHSAAIRVPFREHSYLNSIALYGGKIYHKLMMLCDKLGNRELSKRYWIDGLHYNVGKEYLSNVAWFYAPLPLISIVVPTCRPEGFKRLESSIKALTVYPRYEIIEMAGEGTAIQKFNEGVKKAKGEYIVFMADDTEATLGWLTKAYVHMMEKLNGRGCVIFNDGYWSGQLCNHFLISKDMVDELGGEIWHSGYNHNNCDVELHCRLSKKKLVSFCPDAKIVHHHNYCTTPGAAKDKKDEWNIKVDQWADEDRMTLIRRLDELGLKADAWKWCDTFLSFGGYPYANTSIDLRRKFREMDILPIGIKVLNIGIGEGNSGLATQFYRHHFGRLTHLDPCLKYIEADKSKSYLSKDVRYLNYPLQEMVATGLGLLNEEYYDLITAFDVLEHLKKEESLKFIDEVKKAKLRLLVFIPLEKEYRENNFGQHEQDHLSFWTEEDFIRLGFRTEVLKNFHRDGKNVWDALWAIWEPKK